MTKFFVKTDGLNLRAQPHGQIVRTLRLGKKVNLLGDAQVDGWKRVEVKFSGEVLNGVVFGKYLRKPESDRKEALHKACVDQWLRFKRGAGKETEHPFYKIVGEMWRSIGVNLDGRDSNPWSAAFISFAVVKLAKYENFQTSSFHTKYVHDAIQKRTLGLDAPFWGYRRLEKKPKLGDIICAWRKNAHDYHDLENSGAFKRSHCDVIVEINEESVRAIGGNVSNSVTVKSFSLNSQGYLRKNQRITALMKNKL